MDKKTIARCRSVILRGCDDYTRRHMQNTRQYARVLLKTAVMYVPGLGYYQDAIMQAAAIHDVGKKAVPAEILFSCEPLTSVQVQCVRQHPIMGVHLLTKLFAQERRFESFCSNELIVQGVLYHHERWDGSGYPFGLVGHQIPVSAQFVALADVYDALTSPRPYKPPFSHDEALSMIMDGKCGAFSPDMLNFMIAAAPFLERCKNELDPTWLES